MSFEVTNIEYIEEVDDIHNVEVLNKPVETIVAETQRVFNNFGTPEELDTVKSEIESDISKLETDVNSHAHDSTYLTISNNLSELWNGESIDIGIYNILELGTASFFNDDQFFLKGEGIENYEIIFNGTASSVSIGRITGTFAILISTGSIDSWVCMTIADDFANGYSSPIVDNHPGTNEYQFINVKYSGGVINLNETPQFSPQINPVIKQVVRF